MKTLPAMASFLLLFALLLSACAPAAQPEEPAAAATEPPAAAPAATEAPAASPEPTEPAGAEPAGVQHTAVPGDPPSSGGERWGDHSTISSNSPARALLGDRFSEGRFERPYNADTMDVYFPHLDLDSMVVHPGDETWVYAIITTVGRDANNAFTGQYAIELDLDQNGKGEFLIVATNPSAAEWTTDGVRVYQDANGDIGGAFPFKADTAGSSSDGYETVLFDQGAGDDPDLAWTRLDPNNPNSFQIAYKQALRGTEDKYTAGVWAATSLDAALFDYNDHFTHEQAGAANVEFENFYPIKGLAEFDNTCRQAINYDASGLEPGICPVQ